MGKIFGISDILNAVFNRDANKLKVETDLQINEDGSVPVELKGSNVINHGIVNVTTAGTRVQLPNLPCREVTIIAKRTNTGYIYVGGSNVSSTSYGVELAAKDSITLVVNNANLIWIDASVSGEGITYVAI